MPICDGMQATRKIREFEKNSLKPPTAEPVEKTEESNPTDFLPKTHRVNFGVPIIAVSASLHEAQRKDILEAGMDGWILKPVDFNRLATLMIASVDLATRAEMVYKFVHPLLCDFILFLLEFHASFS
jgi:CheY-like chemotaxis protein